MLATPSLLRGLLPILLLLLPAFAQAQASGSEADASGYGQLADVLENEVSRERLIEELHSLASGAEQGADESQGDDADAAEPAAEAVSMSRRVARLTQGLAEQLAAEFSESMAAFSAAGGAAAATDWGALARASVDLVAVIIAVLIAFFLMRRLCAPLYGRLNGWSLRRAESSALLRKSMAVLAATGVDILLIVVAWVAGFALALYVLSEPGAMDPRQTMFLNAFLLVEAFKALIRMLFATRFDGLRLLPMGDEGAAYWNAWFARISGFIGYGLLLAVPIVNVNVSPEAGRALTVAIMLLAFLYALSIILQNKLDVRERMQRYATNIELGFARLLLYGLARVWHLLALAYFAALVIVGVLQAEEALPFMLRATVQTLLAIGGGVFVAVVLAQIISRRIQLPEETRQKFPLLEARLNGAVPGVLQVVRVVILAIVALIVLDAWAVFNLPEWLASDAGTATLITAISVGLILLVAKAIWIGFASWVELRLNPENKRGGPTAREQTLLSLFRSAFLIVLVVLTAMIVLAEIGINIGPLIAGAGVLGLAIGFGAQKLVQDVITGVFIQLENAINTGDVVTAGSVTGTAEKVTVRSVGIRDLSGTYHIVPFSSVDTVSNFMRDFAFHVGVYRIAYREDIDHAMAQLHAAYDTLVSDPEQAAKVLEPLELHGVTELADSAVNIRVRIKTTPGNQWAIGREYNRLVKKYFDAAGIEIPFPHTTLYFGEDKAGRSPAANVRVLEAGEAESRSITEGPKSATSRAKPNPVERGDFDEEGN
ncbi:mechanosensitive ion channel domain-containing protein [Algiphilus aromaticivorans]|uniref:mechanosensitive ion channel domain-containing protein n=1 Tax=Algiphilus aromaticivorans TaxID=382454 RepID=UPI0005C22029|nr:mechanosensitive ion channel domain-containing protein [Algiphilus aromaticivorans]